MKDWNEFMVIWNDFHRHVLIPYMKTANKEDRRLLNDLIKDLKSSLKWSRLEDCVKIFKNMTKVIKIVNNNC